MPEFGVITAIAWLIGTNCTLVPEATVTLEERVIRVKDIVDVSCLSAGMKGDVADMIVASLPANTDEITVPRSALISLVRRRVPGLQLAEIEIDEAVTLHGPSKTSRTAYPQRCSVAAHFIAAGEIVTQSDVAPHTCEPVHRPPPLAFDRVQRVTRAVANIEPGTSLGAVLVPNGAFDTGDTLDLSISIGSVRIARQVEAVQPGTPGQNIFVRDANGQLISTPTRSPSMEAPNAH